MTTGVTTTTAPTFAERFPLFMRAAYIGAWVLSIWNALRLVLYAIGPMGEVGEDAHAYWLIGQRDELYAIPPAYADAFLYSPAFAQTISPLVALPWPLFAATWIALEVAALVWLLKPLPRRWAVPIGLLCLPELFVGNIYLLLAVVAVAGLRYPALWAFAVLTKITPGVGAVWFLARGEWRQFGVSVAATLMVVAVSFAVAPAAWVSWVEFLSANQSGAIDGRVGLVIRCVLAVALVVYGARRDRRWVIAPAMLLASPINLCLPAATLLVALPRLVTDSRKSDLPQTQDH